MPSPSPTKPTIHSHPSHVCIALHSLSLPTEPSRISLSLRSVTHNITPVPFNDNVAFSISWHQLLFDHIKINVCKKGMLAHNSIYQAVFRFVDLEHFIGVNVCEFPLYDKKNKSKKVGSVHLQLEFLYQGQQYADDRLTMTDNPINELEMNKFVNNEMTDEFVSMDDRARQIVKESMSTDYTKYDIIDVPLSTDSEESVKRSSMDDTEPMYHSTSETGKKVTSANDIENKNENEESLIDGNSHVPSSVDKNANIQQTSNYDFSYSDTESQGPDFKDIAEYVDIFRKLTGEHISGSTLESLRLNIAKNSNGSSSTCSRSPISPFYQSFGKSSLSKSRYVPEMIPRRSIGRQDSFSSASSGTSFRSIAKSISNISMLSDKTRAGFKDLSEMLHALRSTGWNNISSLDFARALLLMQTFHASLEPPATTKIVANASELKIAAYFMDFALPCYGVAAMTYFNYAPSLSTFLSSSPALTATLKHLNIPSSDVLAWSYGSIELYKPTFFAVHDRRTNSIVITIRGTFSLHEALVDTHAEYVPFLHGHAHRGMALAFERFEMEFSHKILDWIRDRGVKCLYFVGHSLGTATSTMYIIKNRAALQEEFGTDFAVRGYHFAPVACIDAPLCLEIDEYIQGYIHGNDVVPTISFGAVMDLKEMIVEAAALTKSSLGTKQRISALGVKYKQIKLNDQYPRLKIPGRLFYMMKTEKGGHYTVAETKAEFFEDILLRDGMVLDHMLNKYDRALRKVIIS